MAAVGGAGRNRARLQAGESEIEQLDVAVRPHHDVLGLDVAMNDLRRVRHRQRLGNLRADVDRPGHGHAALGEQRGASAPSTSSIAT